MVVDVKREMFKGRIFKINIHELVVHKSDFLFDIKNGLHVGRSTEIISTLRCLF